MKKIPNSVKDYISNSNYYLEATKFFPSPTCDAVKILLLLTAWENIKIAEEELHSWAQQTKPAELLYKSHAYKFRDVRKSKSIDRIIILPSGTAKTISYSTGTQFEKLFQICRYGLNGDKKELALIFKTGWFTDDFERFLISKIKWEEMMVKIYEELPDYGKK
jgi:GTPase Era involved in 16S rRNA processing